MAKVSYSLEKVEDDNTGTQVDTLLKWHHSQDANQPPDREVLLNVMDLERLFDTCVSRWGDNWDLNKLCTAVTECEFD